MNNHKSSYAVAVGGIFTALSLVVMLFGSLIPTLTYAVPAIAGALLVVLVIELGKKWALLSYIAVSLLSLLIVPSKEASLLFVAFMGYYPILKSTLEKLKKPRLSWVLKLIVFNAAVLIYYFAVIYFVTDPELVEDTMEYGRIALYILWAAANPVFIIYDLALTRVISVYYNSLRKKLFKK